MPQMGEPNDADPALAKPLIIGDGKCGKSHWAAMAAKAGFNVLYIDGDVGAATINNMIKRGFLTKAEANRIYLMNWQDTILDGQRDTRFIDTWQEFSSTIVFRWNDTQSRIAKRSDPETDIIWEIRPGRMDSTAVLTVDSWSGLCDSITLAAGRANSVDPATASTSEMRPVYQSAGLKATQALQLIRSIRCNVIGIAHPDEFVSTRKKEGVTLAKQKETELVVNWTKMIPKSTSKPHGMQLAKYFTDILWMETNATGSERLVDARISDDRVSGGHWNERKNAEEYSFLALVKEVGGFVPDLANLPTVDSWLKITHNEPHMGLVPAKVLDGTVKSEAKPFGLAGLLQKPTPAV